MIAHSKYNYFNLFLIALFILVNMSCKEETQNIIAEGAELILVSEAYEFTEGPAADKAGNVYFTDQPNDRILKWNAENNTVSEYMKPSGRSNGLYFDNQGNLLSAADENNQLWKIDSDKNVTVLVENFEANKLNGPNDIWVDNKGGVYFTDPYYQRSWWSHNTPQQKDNRVYYLAPNTEKLRIVAADSFNQPNGIIGTPDGKTLYIADQAEEKTFIYNIEADGSLSHKKLFVAKSSDGMTLDNRGNVYLTGDGVTVFNSNGEQIHHIDIPQNWTANVTFGGKDENILFITALGSIYTLKMAVKGVRY